MKCTNGDLYPYRHSVHGEATRVALRKNGSVSIDAPHTRKSLVKGERFMRVVWRA